MKTTLTAVATLLCAGLATIANAQVFYTPTYQITNDAPNSITDIAMFWEAPSEGYGPGILWDPFNQGGIEVAGDGNSTELQDAPKPVDPTGLLLMGLYDDSEGEHLVLFMDQSTASDVQDIEWSNVFPTWDEDQLVYDLQTINDSADQNDWGSALDDLFNFVSGAASNIDDNGQTVSAWLDPALSNQPTPGTIEMWSSGTQIGTFTAQAVPSGSSTPGPEAIVPFGLGLLGLLRRKRT